ncbi:hypothetical protein SAMN05443635_10782 [Roseobacter denitrificans OCh 114]|nr:hypothetical protein SAMN05443635_10782 [Roseobacter denitrificans OCh 114]
MRETLTVQEQPTRASVEFKSSDFSITQARLASHGIGSLRSLLKFGEPCRIR